MVYYEWVLKWDFISPKKFFIGVQLNTMCVGS